ncbi:hypothetical protein [Burkholderia sp. WSM2230]|uniref:hypothetical protein n=1 Tax=Burkholderia sp. WSM2230 TaxID=944435 RepID=UPI0018DD6EB7|nr:hypothetical protein [Burkholderia sp. WSM2230]
MLTSTHAQRATAPIVAAQSPRNIAAVGRLKKRRTISESGNADTIFSDDAHFTARCKRTIQVKHLPRRFTIEAVHEHGLGRCAVKRCRVKRTIDVPKF